jgi:hypothetical protein
LSDFFDNLLGYAVGGFIVFIALLVLDELGIIGDDDDAPAATVEEAVGRVGKELASQAQKVGKAIKAKSIKELRLKRYQPYMDKVVSRDLELERLARRLIGSRCSSTQYDCMAAALTRFVADDIAYWKDPRGKTDYIRSWRETYTNKGGDCEDQTILLASLLESVGLRTLMFFTKGHAYPGVCFDRRPDQRYIERRASYWKVSYRGKQQHCYPLDPTVRGSKVGFLPKACIQAVYDPREHTPLGLQLKGCR